MFDPDAAVLSARTRSAGFFFCRGIYLQQLQQIQALGMMQLL